MSKQIADFLASKIESDPTHAAQLSALIVDALTYGKYKLAGLTAKLSVSHPKIAALINEGLLLL
jgi:hypothetical protein